MNDRYRYAAPIYDAATAVWSGGAIWRSRAATLDGLRAGESVLVPGPGTGRLVALAARLGARVTAVERSQSMANRMQRRLAHSGLVARVIRGDVDEELHGESFDRVVAEHFLNVFQRPRMEQMRRALIDLVKTGGHFAIADFAPIASPTGSGLRRATSRSLQRAYHACPLTGCALLTKNALHPIYDHGVELESADLVQLRASTGSRVYRVGPAWFHTWIFQKHGTA